MCIDLTPADDGIWPQIPCPVGRPLERDLRYSGKTPRNTWPVMMADGKQIGYLCRYVRHGIEEMRLAIYGEDAGKIARWYLKSVPTLSAEIEGLKVKERHDATIVIVPPQDADPAGFENDVVFVRGTVSTGDLFGPSLLPTQRVASQAPVAGQVPEGPAQPECRKPELESEPPAVSIASSCDAGVRDEQSGFGRPADLILTSGKSKTANDDEHPRQASRPDLEKLPLSSTITRASELKMEPVQWLWPKVVAAGKITLLLGEPGQGKSMLAAALAARVSTGSTWPQSDGRGLQGDAVLIAPEDDPGDTLTPRLIAAGADLDRIHFQHLAAGQDLVSALHDLDQRLPELGNVRLLIVDPITACLGRHDLNRAGDMRRVLMPVTEWAQRTGIAVVLISHMNKAAGRNPLGRILGSQTFAAVARAVFLICPDPGNADRRLMLPVKDNIGVNREGIAFRITQHTLAEGLRAPRAVFDDIGVTITAADASASPASGSKGHLAVDEAKEFLCAVLKDGPQSADTVMVAARAAGISLASLRRAKAALHVTVQKGGMNAGWRWALPAAPKMLND